MGVHKHNVSVKWRDLLDCQASESHYDWRLCGAPRGTHGRILEVIGDTRPKDRTVDKEGAPAFLYTWTPDVQSMNPDMRKALF